MNEARKPDDQGPAASRPRLGELLVERGLISQERLDQAVAEGEATGLPLGTILVRDGLVTTHSVAMALADQQGAPLKTEFGFAIGSRAPSGGDVVPLRPPPTSDGMAPPISVPTVSGEPVVERIIEHATLPSAPPPVELQPDRADELDARFAALETVIDGLIDERNELRERLAMLEDLIAAERAGRAVATQRTYSSERHVLLAPNGERYELYERKGPAPEVGTVVELSGRGGFRVLRVGPAPFPGALEACAFLDPLPPPSAPDD